MTDRKWKRRTPPPDMRSLLNEAQGFTETKSDDGLNQNDGNELANKQRPLRDSKGRFVQRVRRRNGSMTRNLRGDFASGEYSSDEVSEESEEEIHSPNQNGKSISNAYLFDRGDSGEENGKKPLSARRIKSPTSNSLKDEQSPQKMDENSIDESFAASPLSKNRTRNIQDISSPSIKNHTPFQIAEESRNEIVPKEPRKIDLPSVKLELDIQHTVDIENGDKKKRKTEEVEDRDALLLLTTFLELAQTETQSDSYTIKKQAPSPRAEPPKLPPLRQVIDGLTPDNHNHSINHFPEQNGKNIKQESAAIAQTSKSPVSKKPKKPKESPFERPKRQRKPKEFSDYDSDFDENNMDLYSTSTKRKEPRRPKRSRNPTQSNMDEDEFDNEENGHYQNNHRQTSKRNSLGNFPVLGDFNGKFKTKRKRPNAFKDDDEYTDTVPEAAVNGNLSPDSSRPKRQRKSLPISAVDTDENLHAEEIVPVAPIPRPKAKKVLEIGDLNNNINSNSNSETRLTKSNSNNSNHSNSTDDVEETDKKRTNVFGRVNRPRLGEIPELEHKKVFCHNKTGLIIGSLIRCDCCKKNV